MAIQVLLINPQPQSHVHLQTLVEMLGGPSIDLHWLPSWAEVQNPYLLTAYDVILAFNAQPSMPVEWEMEPTLKARKHRFINLVNHEFRTPMTSIVSSADLMEMYLERGDYAQVSRHLTRIREGVNLMALTLQEMLSLTELEKGKHVPRPEPLVLPLLLEEVSAELETLFKPQQVVEREHTGPEVVLLDRQLLKIVFIHLLSNASKFSAPDTVIRISSAVNRENVSVKVIDQGMGVPLEDQPFLFDRYYRGRNAVHLPGIGLGLYLTKQYVEMMQGTTGFFSEPGTGSMFWVDFPQSIHQLSS